MIARGLVGLAWRGAALLVAGRSTTQKAGFEPTAAVARGKNRVPGKKCFRLHYEQTSGQEKKKIGHQGLKDSRIARDVQGLNGNKNPRTKRP